jgi:hypothetical protein
MLSSLQNLLVAAVALNAGVSWAAPAVIGESAPSDASTLSKRATLTCNSSSSKLKILKDA